MVVNGKMFFRDFLVDRGGVIKEWSWRLMCWVGLFLGYRVSGYLEWGLDS